MPGGTTLQAGEIHRVWDIFLLTATAIIVTVYVLIFWSIAVYRRRGEGLPPQFHDDLPWEVGLTLLPLLIVTGLFVLTYRAEVRIEHVAADPPVQIRVTGFEWSWRFEYAGGGPTVTGTPEQPPVLVLPVHQPVRIDITSSDVDHAFFVPAFLFKRDAIPGFVSSFQWDLSEPGTYRGECAEFCGLDHAAMNFTVSVRSRQAFADWLRRARAAHPGPATALPPGGRPATRGGALAGPAVR
ncbi:MAG TPA: cytochrome c oxidase subunit II [bacterium]|nr:cytochrome c oxidase subunit II [bacterium]